MKKFLTVLVIAALVASSVFAGFSGSVEASAGYNLDTKEYGFFGVDKKNAKIELVLSTLSADTTPVAKEAEGEEPAVEVPSVYAYVKASLNVKATIGKDSYGEGKLLDSYTSWYEYSDGDINWYKTSNSYNLFFDLKIDEAKVVGENWYVSILGTPSAPKFATAYYDYDEDDDVDGDDDYAGVPYFGANGVEASYAGYVAGVGFHGKAKEGTSATAYVATPAYELFDGFTLQAAGAYSHRSGADTEGGKNPYGAYWSWNNTKNVYELKYKKDAVDAKVADRHNLGGSLKAAYATDIMSASIATDMGISNLAADSRVFGMDVLGNFKYDFVNVDAYFGIKSNAASKALLSTDVSVDLNSFGVPVKVSAGIKDIITDGRKFNAAVEGAFAGVTAKVSGEVDLKSNPGWKLAAEVGYNVMDVATVKGSISFNDKQHFGASVSAETDKLIPGATLGIGWYDAADLLDKNSNTKLDGTFWAQDYDVNGSGELYNIETRKVVDRIADHADYGVIKAFCKIAF